jgi:ferrous iron transport protein B
MVAVQNIELKKEYTVTKITGRWGMRRRIQRLGIEAGKKIIFHSHSRSGLYTFSFSDSKKKRKLPGGNLNFIKLTASSDPSLAQIMEVDKSEIYVDIFRSDITPCINLFQAQDVYNYDGYKFIVNHLPPVATIQGDDYHRKKLRNKVLTDFPDIFLGIVDFENLESDLALVSQFIDMDAKIVVALRNYKPEDGSEKTDFELLSRLLGIPVINYADVEDEDHNPDRQKIFDTIIKTHQDTEPFVRHVHVNFGRQIENSIAVLIKYLKSISKNDYIASTRFLAIGLLEKDPLVLKLFEDTPQYQTVKHKANVQIDKLEKLYGDHVFTIIKNARKAYINGAITEIAGEAPIESKSKKLDKVLTHRVWGIPIFVAFMALTFYSTFELGKYPMGWLESGVQWVTNLLDTQLKAGFWKDLLINGAIDGVGGVLVFLPNIFILFFFIGFLENTGYMSRAAFLMDKYMHKIGLHGKSFIPMIMGFGCTVPAIMSTRILENKRDRILTMMIVPFMSCSARLPVYILMISAFFPEHPVLMLFGIYMFGILLALIISRFFSKTILKQKDAPYIMELMPYRKPTAKLLFSYTWDRGKEYLKKIGGVILIGSVVIWLLGYFPRNVEYSKDYDKLIAVSKNEAEISDLQFAKQSEEHEKSYIGQIGHFIEPAMKPLGFDWKMSVSILAGIAGKEITVSTMGVLYQATEDGEGASLQNKLKAETYTSGDKAGQKVIDKVVALSFIMFILIYFPCIAVISAIWKESARIKWAIFSAVYTTGIAWLVSFAVFQIGRLIG